jgi:hypothetical protein
VDQSPIWIPAFVLVDLDLVVVVVVVAAVPPLPRSFVVLRHKRRWLEVVQHYLVVVFVSLYSNAVLLETTKPPRNDVLAKKQAMIKSKPLSSSEIFSIAFPNKQIKGSTVAKQGGWLSRDSFAN